MIFNYMLKFNRKMNNRVQMLITIYSYLVPPVLSETTKFKRRKQMYSITFFTL